MGHQNNVDPLQSVPIRYIRSRKKGGIEKLNETKWLFIATFMIISCQFLCVSCDISGSSEIGETTTILPTTTIDPPLQTPPTQQIVFEKPKIKLTVVELEFGVISSSKTVIPFTQDNVTKIIDEDEYKATEENELEGDDDDNHVAIGSILGYRPGGRNGPLITQRLYRLECTSNYPVEFGYQGCGVCHEFICARNF